jgi:hypothetical protein
MGTLASLERADAVSQDSPPHIPSTFTIRLAVRMKGHYM